MLGHFIGYGLNFCSLFTGDKVRGVFDGLKIQYFITGILIGITAFPIQFASMFDGVGVTCVGSKAFYQEIANTFVFERQRFKVANGDGVQDGFFVGFGFQFVAFIGQKGAKSEHVAFITDIQYLTGTCFGKGNSPFVYHVEMGMGAFVLRKNGRIGLFMNNGYLQGQLLQLFGLHGIEGRIVFKKIGNALGNGILHSHLKLREI